MPPLLRTREAVAEATDVGGPPLNWNSFKHTFPDKPTSTRRCFLQIRWNNNEPAGGVITGKQENAQIQDLPPSVLVRRGCLFGPVHRTLSAGASPV